MGGGRDNGWLLKSIVSWNAYCAAVRTLCVKCGVSLNYKGPITILSPPGSAMIRDVRRVMPVSIETDTKQLDAALAKAIKLEILLEKCKEQSAAVAASIVTVKDQEEG